MKKNDFFSILALLAMTLLTACSSDDKVAGMTALNSDSEFVEPDNTTPEFSEGIGESPNGTGSGTTTNADGVTITRNDLGDIKWIIFTDKDKAPTSSADLFTQYMGLSTEEFRLFRTDDNIAFTNISLEAYQQQYKGIVLYTAGYNVRFKNGKVTDSNGKYTRIDNLDVKPAFSEQKAREIYAKYLKVSVDQVEAGKVMTWFDDALMIAEFPVSKGSTTWAPRLVYGLSCAAMPDEGYCFIDAHTGRILMTWASYII